MNEKYVKVDDIVEYCNTYSACLQNKGQGVAQAALRRVKEFAKENAAEVQPVKHGRWEKDEKRNSFEKFCSVCKHEAYWDTDYGQQLFDYCPFCGARMDGDSE
jgi:hypothetical protein